MEKYLFIYFLLLLCSSTNCFGQQDGGDRLFIVDLRKCEGDTFDVFGSNFIYHKIKTVVRENCATEQTVNEPNYDEFTIEGPGLIRQDIYRGYINLEFNFEVQLT